MTQAAQLAQYGANNVGLSFKNRIINGDMTIDQRNAGASITPTDTQYSVDRWTCRLNVASKYTAQQNAGSVTPPTGFTNYLGITSTSAYSVSSSDYFMIRQLIEGFNVADLGWGTANAQTVTLSFWVRSSLTGTFGGSLQNDASDRSYPFTYTISAANTWEQKSITVAGDTSGTWTTNNSAGIKLNFNLGNGSTYNGPAGAWAGVNYHSATGAVSVVGTNGATFYITGVQLEKGSVATSFDYLPYGTELMLCQRYYESSFPIGTRVGTSNSGSFYQALGSDGSSNASTFIKFTTPKRATPTMSAFFNGTANVWDYARSGGLGTATAQFTNQSSVGTTVYLTIGAAYVVALCNGDWVANSEL